MPQKSLDGGDIRPCLRPENIRQHRFTYVHIRKVLLYPEFASGETTRAWGRRLSRREAGHLDSSRTLSKCVLGLVNHMLGALFDETALRTPIVEFGLIKRIRGVLPGLPV